jgi:putative transposase
MKKRFNEEQIIGFLREADAGLPIKELCRKHGFSEPSYCGWKAKFGGMSVSDARRLKSLESENASRVCAALGVRLVAQPAHVSVQLLKPTPFQRPSTSQLSSQQL